jgi:colanic acid biosynthesis glycosyl transferase WcaI
MLKGKKITFIGLNYAPEDTAIGLYSTQMVEALSNAGAHVNVITAFPYYPQWSIAAHYRNKNSFLVEKEKNITVYRYKQYVPSDPTFAKRVIHIISFTLGSLLNVRKIEDTDLVISVIPFTASAWIGSRLSQTSKTLHWIHIQDFEFDAALESGLSSGGKQKIFKQLFKLEARILNKAHRVSTISHNMIKKLSTKTDTPSYYLPNWIDENMIDPAKSQPHPYLNSDKFKLLYSGNVGDKQDWEFFIAFAKALSPQHYDIIIVGAGAKYQALKKQVQLENIQFYDPVPLEDLSDLLCSADAHFLFQKTEVIDTVMPSKLLGMMASAKPSLILGNAASEVKTVINESNAGVYLDNADVVKATSAVENWRKNPQTAHEIGQTARKFVTEKFAKAPILNAWIHALGDLMKKY